MVLFLVIDWTYILFENRLPDFWMIIGSLVGSCGVYQPEKITTNNSCRTDRLEVSARLMAARACRGYGRTLDVIKLIID